MNKENLEIIISAYLRNLFVEEWNELSEELKVHVASKVDYSNVPDRYMAMQHRRQYIQWNRVDKMQAVRLATRDMTLMEYFDFDKYEYNIREIFYLIKENNNLIFDLFKIDLNGLTRSDAAMVLSFGNYDIKNKMDISKYSFGFIDSMNIIRAFKYDRNIIIELGHKKLKDYQITEILIETGEENLDLFDLDILNTLNWLNILKKRPEFVSHCDFNKFVKGDPFNIIQLVTMFKEPDLYYLMDTVDKSSITPFGWRKLLIANPDRFVDDCDFSLLNEADWIEIGRHRPDLLVHKL